MKKGDWAMVRMFDETPSRQERAISLEDEDVRLVFEFGLGAYVAGR